MRASARFVSTALILLFISILLGLPQENVRAVSNSIVISQVYGGGGEFGVKWKNDYIELYNSGLTAVDVTGWSVQFTHEDDTQLPTYWYKTELTGVIEPGEYYLIQEGNGAGYGTDELPAPDVVDANPIYALHGNVALVPNNITLAAGICPAGVVDFFGYGNAKCYEAAAFQPTSLEHTYASIRKNGGCTDTDNNSLDFNWLIANPRNSSTTRHYCIPPTDP